MCVLCTNVHDSESDGTEGRSARGRGRGGDTCSGGTCAISSSFGAPSYVMIVPPLTSFTVFAVTSIAKSGPSCAMKLSSSARGA